MGSERLWEIVISALSGGGLLALGWKALEYLKAWWRTTIGGHASVEVQRIKAASLAEERLYERVDALEEQLKEALEARAKDRATYYSQLGTIARQKNQIEDLEAKVERLQTTSERLRKRLEEVENNGA